MIEGTRLLRWSGESYRIGSHRIGSEKASVSQIEEPSRQFGFAWIRHSRDTFHAFRQSYRLTLQAPIG